MASLLTLSHTEETVQNSEYMVDLGNPHCSAVAGSLSVKMLTSILNRNKNNNKIIGNAEYLMFGGGGFINNNNKYYYYLKYIQMTCLERKIS